MANASAIGTGARIFVLLLLVLVPWFGVHAVFFGEPRFHIPVLPIMAVLAMTVPEAMWAVGRRRLQGEAADADASEVGAPRAPGENDGERV